MHDLQESYDQTPYDSRSFPQSHPDRLATLGTLGGLHPTPVQTCRVLELGCASGGNLIPLGFCFPLGQFVGIDISPNQIALGQALVDELELKNVTLVAQDLMQLGPELGTFDYIIAHGFYSWVPAAVRQRALQVCGDLLAPHGVAFMSFNCLPGWGIRSHFRHLVLYGTEAPDPLVRAREARHLLAELADLPPDPGYKLFWQQELATMQLQNDPSLLHDQMEEHNNPVYFHHFMAEAGEHGLQYLSEADWTGNFPNGLTPQIAGAIHHMARDRIHAEQLMDFVLNRVFRQTLLCRSTAPLSAPTTARVQTLRVAGANTSLGALSTAWPQSVPFHDLVPGGVDANSFAQQMLHDFGANRVLLRTCPLPFTTVVGRHPVASRLARVQARTLPYVTNQVHESVKVDPFVRGLIMRLDGERDVSALIEDLARQADHTPELLPAGSLESDRHASVSRLVHAALPQLARAALLTG